ncbi:ABC transporter ATP-binding protein [Porphyrobacter sp. AAP60]|uniref:ABC transporter ATP-binding protein n=1 Tax=Porphyrobacter sp. AAP60 TaxID=1523423 RepID=UPI0006CE024F|nr:ABC transporter ATP-binding protein [Porphyrobacter sp. AAP60]KPF62244.1 ABC transporter ATP-binding protein [Porphyrobacter sp. AAP60]
MSLEFRHIAHAYGQVRALEDISFAAPTGEITCLLGASGCGKSTLLGLAAGMLTVQQGAIALDGEVLADERRSPPPEARPVGLVFQDGALFPHMTIAANVAFGLPKALHGDVEGWLASVGLAGMGARYPHELSGGQQQRAALARAIAPGPQVLLMDEPFASVDIVLRRKLRRDCRILLREAGATVVLVTHDPAEALDIADRIAVMDSGRIVQFGTPQDLHLSPQTAAVGAIFSGAQVIAGGLKGQVLDTDFGLWPMASLIGDLPDGPAFDLLVQADRLVPVPDKRGCRVRDVHPMGARTRVLLETGDGTQITAETLVPVDPAQKYSVLPDPGSVRAFVRS